MEPDYIIFAGLLNRIEKALVFDQKGCTKCVIFCLEVFGISLFVFSVNIDVFGKAVTLDELLPILGVIDILSIL
jgi:hypothetical protein